MGSQTIYTSIVVALLTSCGAVDMPDSGVGKTSNANGVTGSSEATFDLSGCGFDISKPQAGISSRRMAMTPQNKTVTTKILGGILTSQTAISITGMSIVEDSLSRSVSTFTAQSTPTVTSDEVTAQLTQYNSGVSSDLLDLATRAKIGETYPEWKGVFCGFQPARKLERGSTQKVTAELSKPLPVSPLVIAPLARLKSEMGVKRSWTGIAAKVVESSDPDVITGTVWTGRADSVPVSSSTVVDGPSGKVTIQSEIAVKMTYDFGSVAANKALGLPKSVTWYLDTASKGYKLMQVDFGDGSPVNFLPAK